MDGSETPNIEEVKKDSASPETEHVRPALKRLNTPFGQRTDGTETAAEAVEEVAQVVESVVEGIKTAAHEAVA
ncbi:hypothetical protein N0V91_000952 [Didymella pomorum]|uniref:Uncharacterized protein n=1 Tax=Didymella pomorum TaxID=749634 RepID=A0A9W8ZNL0_9PLEO|nr:hypothetical protein N0V91_000952 [Didymella pomorum]